MSNVDCRLEERLLHILHSTFAVRRSPLVVAVLLVLTSCYPGKRVELWTPQPLVRWDRLSTQPIQPLRNGYRILVRQPTFGLFPASMVVTRLAVENTDEVFEGTRPYLLVDPRNELLQWNRAFDDLMAISEVFPISERDLGGGRADLGQILAAFRALHARLGLIYAVNELSETESETIGVLYDTELLEPVASFHAQAVSATPPEENGDGEPADHWEIDSRALVRKKFERLVHACIRELISHDERGTGDGRAGWMTTAPILPVEWPPRVMRAGYRSPP